VTERPEPNPYPRRKWIEYGALPAAVLFWVGVYLFAPVPCARTTTRRTRCASNLKQILYACQLYAGDNVWAFPADLGVLYPDYIPDASVFICPKTLAPVVKCQASYSGALTDANVSVCYVAGLTAEDDPGYVIAFEEEWNHDAKGVSYTCIGGQVGWQHGVAKFHEWLARQGSALKAKGREMKVLRPSWSTWPEEPPWLAARRFWWIAGGSAAGALFAATAALLIVLHRRKRRRFAEAEVEHA
jgi:hypothetical protein